MTQEQILEILDSYKLRIPPTVYYELLVDVVETEEKQESMVEIDLYSVIKQKYIERDVLDKIRAEIEHLRDCEYDNVDYAYIAGLDDVLGIFDKYKADGSKG